jgi:hypothetical protein
MYWWVSHLNFTLESFPRFPDIARVSWGEEHGVRTHGNSQENSVGSHLLGVLVEKLAEICAKVEFASLFLSSTFVRTSILASIWQSSLGRVDLRLAGSAHSPFLCCGVTPSFPSDTKAFPTGVSKLGFPNFEIDLVFDWDAMHQVWPAGKI